MGLVGYTWKQISYVPDSSRDVRSEAHELSGYIISNIICANTPIGQRKSPRWWVRSPFANLSRHLDAMLGEFAIFVAGTLITRGPDMGIFAPQLRYLKSKDSDGRLRVRRRNNRALLRAASQLFLL
jgi:hypothetical protein